MAKLSPEIRAMASRLQEQLLDIVDAARGTEFVLAEQGGETTDSIVALDGLMEISQQAVDRYAQLSRLRLYIAEAQPTVPPDVLRLWSETLEIAQSRIPALARSIEEIKLDWGLA